jgi:hypothetical protein
MNVKITDATALSVLRPLEVVSYLRSNGWRKGGEQPGNWSRWLRADRDGDEFEVTVPLNHQFRDFAARMGDVLQVLAACEGRSQLQILRDLQVMGADVIRLRLVDAEFADATVPLDEGVIFVERSRDLMLAVACAVVNPRAYYPSRKPAQAIDYIRKARLGQTEAGSFVVTILSLVPPSLSAPDGQLIAMEEPYERQVTQRLAIALNAVRQAAEDAATTGQVNRFVEAVPSGVSANLCDALAGMGSFSEGSRRLAIEFSWSRNRPLARSAEVPNQVFFDSDAFPLIRQPPFISRNRPHGRSLRFAAWWSSSIGRMPLPWGRSRFTG